MNEFWTALKALEGRTVKEVRPHQFYSQPDAGLVENGVEFECEDGYRVAVKVDYEDLDLALGDLDQTE